MNTPEHFTLPITVQPGDIDEQGHVNNVVFLRYVQDVATAHWRARAHADDQAALVWVVVRHEIDYKRQAFLGDPLVAETWVGPATRRTFERNTRITHAADGRVVVEARTLWCPLDAVTLRPTEPSAGVRERFAVPGTLER
jgi:acyl-CoA thioester hydrolase